MANHPLRRFRENNALTLEALAELAGISAPSLSRIETWQQTPSLALVSRLIKVSNGELSADDFLQGVQ
jgi:transcriptional regulator with XRE-family HTH domain